MLGSGDLGNAHAVGQQPQQLRADHNDLRDLPVDSRRVKAVDHGVDAIGDVIHRRRVDHGVDAIGDVIHRRRVDRGQIKLSGDSALDVLPDAAHRLLEAFAHAEGHVRTNLVGEHFRRRVDAEQAFHAVDDAAEEACHLVGNPANHGRNTAPNTFDNALADIHDAAHQCPDTVHDGGDDLRQLRYELRDGLNNAARELKQELDAGFQNERHILRQRTGNRRDDGRQLFQQSRNSLNNAHRQVRQDLDALLQDERHILREERDERFDDDRELFEQQRHRVYDALHEVHNDGRALFQDER